MRFAVIFSWMWNCWVKPVLKQLQHQHGEAEAQRGGYGAEYQAFDGKLLDDAPAAGSQGSADGDLTLPCGGTCEHEAGAVDAGDQP